MPPAALNCAKISKHRVLQKLVNLEPAWRSTNSTTQERSVAEPRAPSQSLVCCENHEKHAVGWLPRSPATTTTISNSRVENTRSVSFEKKKRRYLENWKSVIKVEREEAITWDAKVTGNGGTKVTLQGGCTFFCKLFVSHAVSCQCRWSEPAKCCCAAKTCSVNWNGLVGFCVCQGFVVAFYGRSSGEIFWADFVLSTTRRCFE